MVLKFISCVDLTAQQTCTERATELLSELEKRVTTLRCVCVRKVGLELGRLAVKKINLLIFNEASREKVHPNENQMVKSVMRI